MQRQRIVSALNKGKEMLLRTIRVKFLTLAHNGRCSGGALCALDVDQLPEKLEKLAQRLQHDFRRSEACFLRLGELLQRIYGEASTLTDTTSEAAYNISLNNRGGLLHAIRDHVDARLRQVTASRRAVAHDLEQVDTASERLSSLFRICNEMEKAGVYYQVVGTNMGIESTRSAAASGLFGVVASDVKGLAKKIIAVAEKISEGGAAVRSQQQTAHDKISQGLIELKRLGKESESACQEALKGIERVMNWSSEILDTTSMRWGNVGEEVGKIVVAIQAQDRMNQRVEHVTSALLEIKEICSRPAHHASKNGADDAKMASALTTVRLQIRQLEEIIADLEGVNRVSTQAFERMVDDLRSMAASFATLRLDSGPTGQEGKGVREGELAKLMSALRKLGLLTAKGQELSAEVRGIFEERSKTIVEIMGRAEEVLSMSVETKLVALNASVKAAHLGEVSGPLEVLARELSRLARDLSETVSEVSATLESAGVLGEQATTKLGGAPVGRPSDSSVGRTSGDDAVLSLYEDAARGMRLVYAQGEGLGERVAGINDSVSFLPRLAERLKGYKEQLKEIENVFLPWEDTSSGMSTPSDLAALAARYTMDEERNVHAQVLGAGGVELRDESNETSDFSAPGEGEEKNKEARKQEGTEFGDNVELF